MASGERKHFFPIMQGMTQKDPGIPVGFPERSAAVRLTQYEADSRRPKADLTAAPAQTPGAAPQAPDILIIRKYHPTDCKYLAELFYQTVHSINAKDYTDEQLNAWATGNVDMEKWNQSLSGHFSLVAIKDDIIAGFGDIDRTGYLDRLYVHRDYQSQGIATAICNELEHAFQVSKITTHASITAKPFFLHRGYKIIREQQVIRSNIPLTNYIMEKQL